ncbi:hypothetical protein PsWM33_02349 [Pseudovibrio sp. WM33]|nr:hypothetical protein PsWM33_02349 [Pseudovibrio sp. WM33]
MISNCQHVLWANRNFCKGFSRLFARIFLFELFLIFVRSQTIPNRGLHATQDEIDPVLIAMGGGSSSNFLESAGPAGQSFRYIDWSLHSFFITALLMAWRFNYRRACLVIGRNTHGQLTLISVKRILYEYH